MFFLHKDNESEIIRTDKKNFKIFDFFANYEYFEEKYNYDEVLKLPQKIKGAGIGGDGIDIDEIAIFKPDPLKTLAEIPIGLKGMKIDRKLFDKFEEIIKKDHIAKERYKKGDVDGVENHIKENIFEKPEEYFNLEKLRKSVKADRRISLREIIEKIFGRINRFKTKDELLEEEVEKFVSIHKPENKYIYPIKNFLKAYITDSEIRDVIEKKGLREISHQSKINNGGFARSERLSRKSAGICKGLCAYK